MKRFNEPIESLHTTKSSRLHSTITAPQPINPFKEKYISHAISFIAWFEDYLKKVKVMYENIETSSSKIANIRRNLLNLLSECEKMFQFGKKKFDKLHKIHNFLKNKSVMEPKLELEYPMINFYTRDESHKSWFTNKSPLSLFSFCNYEKFEEYDCKENNMEDAVLEKLSQMIIELKKKDSNPDKITIMLKFFRYIINRLLRAEFRYHTFKCEKVDIGLLYRGETMDKRHIEILEECIRSFRDPFYVVLSPSQMSTSRIKSKAKNFSFSTNGIRVLYRIHTVQPSKEDLDKFLKLFPEVEIQSKFVDISRWSVYKEAECLGFEIYGKVVRMEHVDGAYTVETVVPEFDIIPYCDGEWTEINTLEKIIRKAAGCYFNLLNQIAVCRKIQKISSDKHYDASRMIESSEDSLKILLDVLESNSNICREALPIEIIDYLSKVSPADKRQNDIFKSFHLTTLTDLKVVIIGERSSQNRLLSSGVAYSQVSGFSYRDYRNLFLSNYLVIKALQYDFNVYGSKVRFWHSVCKDFANYAKYKAKYKAKYNESGEIKSKYFRDYIESELNLNFDDNDSSAYDFELSSGNLEGWQAEGVLLLNMSLTTDSNDKSIDTTQKIVKTICSKRPDCVFIVWSKKVGFELNIPSRNLIVHQQPVTWLHKYEKCWEEGIHCMMQFIKGKFFSRANNMLPPLERVNWLLDGRWGYLGTDRDMEA